MSSASEGDGLPFVQGLVHDVRPHVARRFGWNSDDSGSAARRVKRQLYLSSGRPAAVQAVYQ